MPSQPPGRRRLPPTNPLLARRPGPPSRVTTAPAGAPAAGGRLRDISLASLLEGVDQVPSARKRLIPTSTGSGGVLAAGAARPAVMQPKVPQR